MTPPPFHPNLSVFPLDQIARVGVSPSRSLKPWLFSKYSKLCENHTWTLRTDRRTTYWGVTALCVASRGKKCLSHAVRCMESAYGFVVRCPHTEAGRPITGYGRHYIIDDVTSRGAWRQQTAAESSDNTTTAFITNPMTMTTYLEMGNNRIDCDYFMYSLVRWFLHELNADPKLNTINVK